MKEEKIFFKNSKGQKLCGLLALQEKKSPLIILVHGMMSRTDKHEFGMFDKLSQILYDEGFSAFRFDFSGHGESEGEHVNVTLEQEIDDLKCAIDFIIKQNVDNEKIGILANSFGTTVTILLNDKRIKVIQLDCPTTGFRDIETVFEDANPNWKKEVKERGFFLYKKARLPENRKWVGMGIYNHMKNLDLRTEINKIKIPIKILCPEFDEYIPVEDMKKLYESANEPKEFDLIKGATHGFWRAKDFSRITKLAIEWFKKYLL